jgi:hypothetical protein
VEERIRLARRDRFSVFVELNAALYLGVLFFVAGVGWTVTTYSARLGDVAILLSLTCVFGWSLYYCFDRAHPYSHHRVEPPSLASDYVLSRLPRLRHRAGYLESRFHPFGSPGTSPAVASAVFFGLACRDRRFVLAALSSGWMVQCAYFPPDLSTPARCAGPR